MSANQYKPLVDDEIRLLRLLSNAPDGPVELSVANYPLSSCPRYDALSYVWGPPSEITTALLDGHAVTIRTNLDAFLRQAVPAAPDFTPSPSNTLLPGPEVHLLWVDALCIDQANIAERNAQVLRMGTIYARADRVLAWLGPTEDDSDLAMDAMRNLSLSALRDDDHHLAAVVANQMDDGDYLLAIIRLVQHRYWRRAWIIQEITAPCASPASRNGPVMWCGDRRMAWALFGLATLRIYRYVERFRTSFARFQSILGGNDRWLDRMRRARLRPGEHPPLTMLRALRSVQGFEATDPRDKIYAFLALAVDGGHPDLRPDYGCAVEEVYRRFVVHLVSYHNHLDVLGHCQDVNTPRARDPETFVAAAMPSWVPDWTLQPVRPLPKRSWTVDGGYRPLYNACGGHSNANVEFDDPMVMAVEGIVVDRVQEVAPRRDYEKLGAPEEDWPLAKAWTAVGVGEAPDESYPCISAGGGKSLTRLDAFRHTLCADSTSDEDPKRGHACLWPIQDILAADDAAPVDTFVGDFLADFMTRRRRLFRTARGYVGLSAGPVSAGDKVCVLFGSLVPIVLRKEDDSWRVIGECYMHGIMDGEAFGLGLPTIKFSIV